MYRKSFTCPCCKNRLIFRQKFKLDSRKGKRCPFCNEMIGMPWLTYLPVVLISMFLGGIYGEWMSKNIEVAIILVLIYVATYEVITTILIPIVKKEQ